MAQRRLAAAVGEDDAGQSSLEGLAAGQKLPFHIALGQALQIFPIVETGLGDETFGTGEVLHETGHVGQDDEAVGSDGQGDGGGQTVAVDVEIEAALFVEGKRRHEGKGARAPRRLKRFSRDGADRAAVVVAEDEAASPLDGAEKILALGPDRRDRVGTKDRRGDAPEGQLRRKASREREGGGLEEGPLGGTDIAAAVAAGAGDVAAGHAGELAEGVGDAAGAVDDDPPLAPADAPGQIVQQGARIVADGPSYFDDSYHDRDLQCQFRSKL